MKPLKTSVLILIFNAYVCSLHAEAPSDKATEYSSLDSSYETIYNLSGAMWLQDKGVMLRKMAIDKEFKSDAVSGNYSGKYTFQKEGRIDNRRTLPYNLHEEGTCITVKVQSDFDALNENASPATFTWTKDSGSPGALDADAAIRVDLWTPWLYRSDGAEASIALGYEINRADVEGEEIDLQSYRLSLPFVPKVITDHIPFLDSADQVFQLHLSYNLDGVSGEEGFDVDTDYRPTFVLPFGSKEGYGFWIGTRCDFKGKPIDPAIVPTGAYYSIEPVAGLSYGDKYSLGNPVASLDQQFVASYQVSAKIGSPIGGGANAMLVEARYTLKGASALSKNENFVFHEIGLSLQPARTTNPVSLNLAYLKGQNGFGAVDLNRFVVGLGVKF